MADIKFSKEEKDILVGKIKAYLKQEFDLELGQFDTEFFLDFLSEKIGPYYYNRGLQDAFSVMQSQMDNITDALYEIEKPTDFVR